MDLLDKQLEQFFETLKKQKFSNMELQNICKPIYDQKRKEILIIWISIIIFCSVAYTVIAWSDSVQWLLSALGRILLLQLLPYWDWPQLYNVKCLIERPIAKGNDKPIHHLNEFESVKTDCLLCEDLEYIPTVSNTTFSVLENMYLERGLPVVITDSHHPISDFDEFFYAVFSISKDYFDSRPCDVSTNLILSHFFDLEIVLKKAWKLTGPTDKWFLQLRNCKFNAVKSLRRFIKRPYYYPVHLAPFYSSWMLLSHSFNGRAYQDIYVQGLIIVQQLKGFLDIKLSPKIACADKCPMLNIRLEQGEGFVFSTDLWLLSYRFASDTNEHESIATVMEIDWIV